MQCFTKYQQYMYSVILKSTTIGSSSANQYYLLLLRHLAVQMYEGRDTRKIQLQKDFHLVQVRH